MKYWLTLPILAGLLALPAGAQSSLAGVHPETTLAEISVEYSALHMNAPVGGCGCFWNQGGSAELAVPVWRHVSGVVEVSGEHAGSVPGFNTGFSLISGLGGVRVTHKVRSRYVAFGQALFGGVHAFDSFFPGTSAPTTYATSFAMTEGLGLDIILNKHVHLRAVQADYQYMQLPNNSTNQQHDIRLSAGVAFSITHRR